MAAMTWEALRSLWRKRDNLYRMRRKYGEHVPISPEEEAAIRWYRNIEAETLLDGDTEGDDYASASLALDEWTPPMQWKGKH